MYAYDPAAATKPEEATFDSSANSSTDSTQAQQVASTEEAAGSAQSAAEEAAQVLCDAEQSSKEQLGLQLFPLVSALQPECAVLRSCRWSVALESLVTVSLVLQGKITGMMLDMDNDDIVTVINDRHFPFSLNNNNTSVVHSIHMLVNPM